MMNEQRQILYKILFSLIIPLVTVTLGGLIVYGNFMTFLFPADTGGTGEVNGPAMLYYGIGFLMAAIFYLLREFRSGYEFVAIGIISLIYSFALKNMKIVISSPIYVFLLPILLFFSCAWLIMKFIFLNRSFRQARLLMFTLLNSAAFGLAFYVQYLLLGQEVPAGFFQARFMSGLMLFIFLGFGLTIAEYLILKIEVKAKRHSSSLDLDAADQDDDEKDL